MLGQNISALVWSLVENTGYTLSADETANTPTTKAYNEAGELFLARVTGINVTANAEDPDEVATPFMLRRAVSMIRGRINKNFTNTVGEAVVDNNTVDFANAASEFRVRKAGNALNYAVANNGTKAVSGMVASTVIYAKRAWLTDAPAGYVKQTSPEVDSSTPAVKLDLIDDDQQAFQDMLIFPGGAEDGTGRFDVVVSGWAPAGYSAQGGSVIGTGGALVHWSATINGFVLENNILELNFELRTQGKPDVPAVIETGNLEIDADLVPWGALSQITVPM
jgi:hypothetical protein